MASIVGIGGRSVIAAMPSDSTLKGLKLRSGYWLRKWDQSLIPPGSWAEMWIGVALEYEFYTRYVTGSTSALTTAGQVEIGHNKLVWIGLANGQDGCFGKHWKDGAGKPTNWFGLVNTSSGANVSSIMRTSVADGSRYYVSSTIFPRHIVNGVTTAAAGTAQATPIDFIRCSIWRIVRTAPDGNYQALAHVRSSFPNSSSVEEMRDLMNAATSWSNLRTLAAAAGWFDSWIGFENFAISESSDGVFDSVEIGHARDQVPLCLDAVLLKPIFF